jgi:hypothetical protein
LIEVDTHAPVSRRNWSSEQPCNLAQIEEECETR